MPTPQNTGNLQPYTPLLGVAGTPATIPNRSHGVNIWTFDIPDAAGNYDFITPANIDVEIIAIRFKRGAAGNAADTYSVRNGITNVIGLITAAAGANTVTAPPTIVGAFREVTRGTTMRVVVTDAGNASDGELDIYWVST